MRSEETDHLSNLIATFTTSHPTGTTRLRGGSKKGVYRLSFADGSSAVLYRWAAEENYWPQPDAADHRRSDPLSDASGVALFVAAHTRLEQLGVGVPRLLCADAAAGLAFVEDFPRGTLEALLRTDPSAGTATLDRLAADLRLLHAATAAQPGKLLGPTAHESAAEIVVDRARQHLAESADRVPSIAAVRDRLADLLAERFAAVAPRSRYTLIHGELGPDHVLVDDAGRPVLIDIEGLLYFDVEWEHVFLRLRFGEHYDRLRTPEPDHKPPAVTQLDSTQLDSTRLDGARMALYELAMRLSLVAGPLRLLDTDFPDRDFMAEIARANTAQLLTIADHP